MKKPCPYCDQPDASLLRLVLIGEILRADEITTLAPSGSHAAVWSAATLRRGR